MTVWAKALAVLLAVLAFASEAPALEIESQLQRRPCEESPRHTELTCAIHSPRCVIPRQGIIRLPVRASARVMRFVMAVTLRELPSHDRPVLPGDSAALLSLHCLLTI
jgi:hypothetical protein